MRTTLWYQNFNKAKLYTHKNIQYLTQRSEYITLQDGMETLTVLTGHKIGTYVMTQRDIQYKGDGGCKHRGFEMKMGDH